ncbi:MAG: hypothetical protein AB7V56_06825 [Candidatus Nitrosocosmicus sp.]
MFKNFFTEIDEGRKLLDNYKKLKKMSSEVHVIYYINLFSQINKKIQDSDRLMMTKIDVGSPDGFTGRGKKKSIDLSNSRKN